jgi:hypothetical protein
VTPHRWRWGKPPRRASTVGQHRRLSRTAFNWPSGCIWNLNLKWSIFRQILKAGTPVVLMVMLRAAGMARVTARLAASVVAMACGVAVASAGELRFSVVGIVIIYVNL